MVSQVYFTRGNSFTPTAASRLLCLHGSRFDVPTNSHCRPTQRNLIKLVTAGLKSTVAVLTLYALCLAAPCIYRANPAVRELEHQNLALQSVNQETLSWIGCRDCATLEEAVHLDDPQARQKRLRDALARARRELEGTKEVLQLQKSYLDRMDTLGFCRWTGNKVLALCWQVSDAEVNAAYVRKQIEELEQALWLCSAPGEPGWPTTSHDQ